MTTRELAEATAQRLRVIAEINERAGLPNAAEGLRALAYQWEERVRKLLRKASSKEGGHNNE